MSLSIYYTAFRETPLTEAERQGVMTVKDKYSVNKLIEEYCQTGRGLNWESFTLYDPPCSPKAIIEGATRLPDNSEDAAWIGVQHWCEALSELRRLIPDTEWRVYVEDHEIQWDSSRQEFDPTK